YGELYKPDSMNLGGGRGNGKDFNMDAVMEHANTIGHTETSIEDKTRPQMPTEENVDISKMPEGFDGSMMSAIQQERVQNENGEGPSFRRNGGGFGSRGSADVRLQYVDDNIDSYTNIWNSAKTDITTADQNRLIASLKKLSSGEDIESVVDVDAVIRYFVVHNYVCNGDSYTGAMIHNYYLYEEDGQLAMLPWDYNLAFGTFRGGNGQNTINTPIDSPVSGSSADRPMWNWIAANEEYTEQYHQYYEEFLNTVDVQSIIDNAYTLIKPYVKKDPTAFYSIEEFETGVETMRQFCKLRSESISMQLANGETVNNMNYVDASGLTLSNMGSMSMGRGGMGGNMPNMGDKNAQQNGNRPSFGNKQPPGGDVSFEVAPMDGENPQTEATPQAGTDRPARGDMRIPGQNNPESNGANLTGWLWIAGSVLILAVGIFIAKMYKW
ncbi:MAG: CotH kinase family protein, partial [Peptococcaceae bacterium]|nr:CotH kinase family protein [Peptococcaceae bacterium]